MLRWAQPIPLQLKKLFNFFKSTALEPTYSFCIVTTSLNTISSNINFNKQLKESITTKLNKFFKIFERKIV